jgi:hypothetical protein
MTTIKNTNNNRCWQGWVEKLSLIYCFCGNVN